MSDHIRATIEELRAEIRPMEEKIVKTKQLINMLCERAGMAPIYPDAELSTSGTSVTLRGDEFFNKPLNTCLKKLFAQRKASGAAPATAEDLFDGLIAGGYEKFPSNKDEAITGLRISLGKSSHTFVRLPNGAYGMAEWYDIKQKPAKQPASNGKPEEQKSADVGIVDGASAETNEDGELKEGQTV